MPAGPLSPAPEAAHTISFTPKHILITGASGAIGGALAMSFARTNPDARQTLVDLNTEPLQDRAALAGVDVGA